MPFSRPSIVFEASQFLRKKEKGADGLIVSMVDSNVQFKLSSYLLWLVGFSFIHHVEEEGPDERTADVLSRPHPPDGEQKGDVAQHPRYKNQCPQLQRAHNENTALRGRADRRLRCGEEANTVAG